MEDHHLELGHGPFAHIQHPRKRAYLEGVARHGVKTRAAEEAGINSSTPYSRQWREDAEYTAALEVAERMAADLLVDEARKRGAEGLVRYQFDRDGAPLRHPNECECGHHRLVHAVGEEERRTSCTECTCERFVRAYYTETAYSDRLLQFLLQGLKPETFGNRLELRGALATLDLARLPDALVDRIANGENPMQVLVSALEGGEVEGLLPPGEEAEG